MNKEEINYCSNCGEEICGQGKTDLCRSCVHTYYNIQTGDENPNWKGDDVGYKQLHVWMRNKMPKPDLCECCKKSPPMDLANKGVYTRDLENWEWLCRRCHMQKDGRMKNLRNQTQCENELCEDCEEQEVFANKFG